MTYRTEFPDFDHDLPALGEGWEDQSWHNDVCPSLFNEVRRLVLWVDFLDLAKREWEDGKVYTLVACDEDGYSGGSEALLQTDNVAEVVAFLAVQAQ